MHDRADASACGRGCGYENASSHLLEMIVAAALASRGSKSGDGCVDVDASGDGDGGGNEFEGTRCCGCAHRTAGHADDVRRDL